MCQSFYKKTASKQAVSIRMKFTGPVILIYFWFHFMRVGSLTPQRPQCHQCDENRFCNCSAKDFQQVPVVPANVLILDVSFNNIESMEQMDLSKYRELKTLKLQNNKIGLIHNDTFSSQQNLEELDLSFNELQHIFSSWFHKLKSLKHLNLLGNLYKTLGSVPLFQEVESLKTLRFGNPLLKEVRSNVLNSLQHLSEMIFVGSNLESYEKGSFKMPQPMTRVSLSLQDLFQEKPEVVSKILRDVSHPETSLIVKDVLLHTKESMKPFTEVRNGGTVNIIMHNMSTTDEGITSFLKVMDGSPVSYLDIEDVQLRGGGWWEEAHFAHLENLHTTIIRNTVIQDFINFSSMLQLGFLLKNPTKIAVINSTVFVMPCPTSFLLRNIEYLDLSQNLLSDLTLEETLCRGVAIMRNLITFNVSQNSLKSIGLISHLVRELPKLTFLDISHNDLLTMPQKCSWPESLTFLNLSSTKLRRVTSCLPLSLTILDLSQNDLTIFHLSLPNLVELNLSGNRFGRFPEGGRFPKVKILLIQSNTLNLFNKSDLMKFGSLRYLEAGLNNFVCSCEFLAFFKYDVDHLITLRDGHSNYVCNSPFPLRGLRVDRAELSVFDCHMVPAVSILCAGLVLTLVLAGVTCHKLHILWYLQMTIAWLQAKRKPAVSRAGESLRYDAFVSYSQHDAEWVEEILVPKLENAHPPFALCLHKRDFLPGRWIVDSIIDSIEKSHRTLFVLSENFVTSEWCRYELDFSHFRIIDEHNDSAVLILLEPIPKETIPKRFLKLRKIMNSRTYLEWPQDEERREEFWNNLRAALKREDPREIVGKLVLDTKKDKAPLRPLFFTTFHESAQDERMKKSLFTVICVCFTWVHILTSPRLSCYKCDEYHFCNCSARNFLHVPAVPENVITLDVSFNEIESIEKRDLSMYTELKNLYMQGNEINTLYEESFGSQHKLEVLDLSFNKLEHISSSWFQELKSLKHLNLLGNVYTTLGSVPIFQFLQNLKSLKFGNRSLKKVNKNVIKGLPQLSEMVFVGSNLASYETASFKMPQPMTRVSLSLEDRFQEKPEVVSKILRDVSHPETSLIVEDVLLHTKESMKPFTEVRNGGTVNIIMHNISTTDEGITSFLKVLDGSPVSYLDIEDVQFRGGGWWEEAHFAHLENLHTIIIRNIEIQGFFNFSSMLQLGFLLKNPTKISVINSTVFVMPCPTSFLLRNIEYLDLSQNLLSDLTLEETLCRGVAIMRNLISFNVSQNSLKSIGLISHLVRELPKLTFLDISHNDLLTMPQKCSWPESLTFLNLSLTKLRRVTSCLPLSLTILDLSQNDLTIFHLSLPNLVELQISGNRLLQFPEGAFPSISTLFIQRNTLNLFNKSDLMKFGSLRYLEAGLNNFVCSCEFLAFFKYDVDHLITLRDGHNNYVCDSPFPLRGLRVDRAELSVFDCHMVPAVSILCAGLVLTLVLAGVTCHKLHILWYLQMTIAWLQAKRKPAVSRAGESLRYDAFVSYSQHDAEWVEEILVPKLENAHPPFALCLHKRDFLPGRWIVDSIIDSIEKSHRTLFVLSENFVTSEWCRYELDFSHFRIIDEHNDSAVLILLEPISKETIPKRFLKLRKIMNSRTYLEWPQDEERREEFWNNLRAALKREDP
ncbi:toll-like receptor 2 [Hoplias malabaricus]|uniref:toll-like receptor 2 n=1 Tax=Hoplias malabaricus TaxID=27720 RepID=UPI00346206CE